MTPFTASWPWWRWALTALNTLALALSAYLAWHYLVGGTVIGCGGGSPCEQVLGSRWSTVGGVLPVSGLAGGTYLSILIASLFIGPKASVPDRRLAWGALLVLVGAAAGSGVWFIFVQKRLIGAFCPYCTATHITGLVLATLVICQAFRECDQSSHRIISPLPVIGLTLLGLCLAGIMAACQFALMPPALYRAGESADNSPAFDPRAVPLVGSPDAAYIVTLLFDYKCPHCQRLHSMLDDAISRYRGKLAFALCPAPLNNQCNPYISRYADEFRDSCELVRIGLTVWLAKRDAFPDFDRWMFSPEPGQPWHPRTVEAAQAKAVELVGEEKLTGSKADPWIDRYTQSSVRIYGATINPDQSGGAVPKLVYGSRWVTSEPNDAEDLVSILHQRLAVPAP